MPNVRVHFPGADSSEDHQLSNDPSIEDKSEELLDAMPIPKKTFDPSKKLQPLITTKSHNCLRAERKVQKSKYHGP